MIQSTRLPRLFVIDGIKIPDPNPSLNLDEVKELLLPIYPSLINARGHEKKLTDEAEIFTFTTTFAPKG